MRTLIAILVTVGFSGCLNYEKDTSCSYPAEFFDFLEMGLKLNALQQCVP